jgi:hypothetical protein
MQTGLYNSITDSIKEKKLYRGFKICIIRAFLVNECALFTYEKC